MKGFVRIVRKSGLFRKICVVILVYFLYCCGVFTHLIEKRFNGEFPLGEESYNEIRSSCLRGIKPDIEPFNTYKYYFKYFASLKCLSESKIKLAIIVKSAIGNFDRRQGIRRSWGFGNRYSDVEMRTVFILGMGDDKELQKRVDKENSEYNDIVQAAFRDDYYNNTIKTLMAYKWAVKYCSDAKFYVFSDDDMYVSIKNVLRFVKNPLDYPDYLEVPVVSLKDSHHYEIRRELRYNKNVPQMLDFELNDKAELYAGYVFQSSRPHRHFWSKWYISLEEYPYDRWPPYVTGGAYILSNVVLHEFYYASQVTQHFRFDDIYISILAYKLNITPIHNDEFYFHKKHFSGNNYKYVIASHGFDNPHELKDFWHHQKTIGNA
ncbi:beta-1,3-galactosyltransferase brn [Cimex lectularius]|uniref:Hexosyltransferase n=1 Tax=Cimex lectularius TaxID=79782 RepID=A0A8I6RPP2_CIMLE|nr:beta-1,3-galactosyltransferase brn [Cimex lectularius]